MTPEDLAGLITNLGVPLGIFIWVAIGIIKLVNDHVPAILKNYQERKADKEEHDQTMAHNRLKHEELMELTEAGARTYVEEQLTQHLSEVYGEFGAVNAFIRETIFATLQRMEHKTDQLVVDIRPILPMSERLAEIRMYVRAINTILKGLDINHDSEDNKHNHVSDGTRHNLDSAEESNGGNREAGS